MTKNEITNAVSFLLNSARTRNTNQGVVVYEKVLEMLAEADSDEEVADILGKLNRSLVGMEAHGEFTDPEFAQVQLLRTLTQ